MTPGESTGRLAPVRPRVRSPFSGEVVLLEDEVEDLLRSDHRHVVFLEGPPETGKRTALEHLRARFPGARELAVCPELDVARGLLSDRRLVLFPTEVRKDWFRPDWVGFELVPWGLDEAQEYLESRHADVRDEVLRRLLATDDASHLRGEPRLWCAVLDAMSAEASLEGARAALAHCLEAETRAVGDREALALWGLTEIGVLVSEGVEVRPLPHGLPPESLIVRSYRALYDWLIEEVLRDLRAGRLSLLSKIGRPLPALVAELGARIAVEPDVVERLRLALKYPFASNPAVLVSLLHVRDDAWLSDVLPVHRSAPPLDLRGALLAHLRAVGADLRRVRLEHAQLGGADLLGADLREGLCERIGLAGADCSGARLDGIDAKQAVLRKACLAQASVRGADLSGADLFEADLRGACLDGAVCEHTDLREARAANATFECARLGFARLDGADLRGARLDGANLLSADLRTVTLRGASFLGASLANARLDGRDLTGVPMRAANLLRADLTGTRLTGADLHGAILDEARMAYVDLEGADLRRARIRKAVFHLGSSRSGMVFSDLASEGTRTGFYTDDDQHLDAKPVEEIRKANLRGADLRAAKVLETDWYLVDLRDARYDERQGEHFRRCRAILEDPTG